MDTTTEKRKTLQNQKTEILEARVIANYGEPGLDENYHFDVLSRFVIVMIESCQRVLTGDKYAGMIAMVKRPETLWISAQGKPTNNIADQQRMDYKNNVSKGIAGSFSSNSIPRIYPEYTMGEVIKIRKLAQPIQPNNPFFYSAFNYWEPNMQTYGSWHSEGDSLSYFQNDSMKNLLRTKAIMPTSQRSNYYYGLLHKMHYEAFALSVNQSDQSLYNGMMAIFNGAWSGNPMVYSANGGYAFASNQYLLLNAVSYEDMNVGQKDRVATNDCIPMVVTTPASFPVPSVRSLGSIAYNPTYSPIAR